MLGHRNFAARFRDSFLDAVLDFQFAYIHHGRKLGNEKESSPVQHPLFAERKGLYPAKVDQILEDFSNVGNRTRPHLLRVLFEAIFPVFLSKKLITAKE